MVGLPNWPTSHLPVRRKSYMSHTLICPISVKYKLVLGSQKKFKQDGEHSNGKTINFKGGRAVVDEETFEMVKLLPGFGIEFMEETANSVLPKPVEPTPLGLGSEQEQEDQKGKLENLTKQVGNITKQIDLLTQVITKLAGDKESDEEKDEEKTVAKKKK